MLSQHVGSKDTVLPQKCLCKPLYIAGKSLEGFYFLVPVETLLEVILLVRIA